MTDADMNDMAEDLDIKSVDNESTCVDIVDEVADDDNILTSPDDVGYIELVVAVIDVCISTDCDDIGAPVNELFVTVVGNTELLVGIITSVGLLDSTPT